MNYSVRKLILAFSVYEFYVSLGMKFVIVSNIFYIYNIKFTTMNPDFGIRNYYKSFKEVSAREENPFLQSVNNKIRTNLKKVKSSEIISDPDLNKETVKHVLDENDKLKDVDMRIGKIKRKQVADFTLLYFDNKIDYIDFSAAALRIVFFIMYEKLALGMDFIVIDPKEISRVLKINKNTTYDALLELINARVIDKRNEYNWWINPNYFYRGNRLLISTK